MNFNCSINDLIDHWNEPEDPLEIYELFEFLRTAITMHISKNQLNIKGIVRIIKDLRETVNPKGDGDVYFFTDRICDRILLKHEGIDEEDLPILMLYIADCEQQACHKH